MTEQVVDPAEEASEPVTEPTPESDEITTWKKRLAGKDQALTTAQKERDAEKARAADLAARLADIERQNESDAERLQRERDEARTDAAQARDEAKRERLARQYPSYAKFLNDTADFTDEDRAAAFETFAAQVGKTETEPRIDANQARRPAPRSAPATVEELTAALATMGNPYMID